MENNTDALPRGTINLPREKLINILMEAVKKHSFVGVSADEESHMLENYYKFIMYRDPVERLVSAYRSKIEGPMVGLKDDVPQFNWAKKSIYAYKHREEYIKWRRDNGNTPIEVTFSDFVDFWLRRNGQLSSDPHFIPIFTLCHPCRVRFNYYGNFKTFEKDADVLIKATGTNSSLLKGSYYDMDVKHTASKVPKYYRQLSRRQKQLIVHKLAWDLSFYYSIFPTEKDSHKEVMDIDYDIPDDLLRKGVIYH